MHLVPLLLACLLAACGGIPLQSLPRLMKLQEALVQADPVEFMVAIQADARMMPPPDAAPVLHLSIRPASAGGFEAVERQLAMQHAVVSSGTLGLNAPAANRRWLIYRLAPGSQAELLRLQQRFRQLQARATGIPGATLAVGIAQEGVAVRDPAFAGTRWESWLQTSRKDGFYPLWSGSVGELLRLADAAGRRARESTK